MLKPFHLVAAIPWVVSACGSYQGNEYVRDCPADAAERVQAADWARVRNITVRVRRDEFLPMIIPLTQGRPYVMHLINGDRERHAFRAPEFFKAIALESATVGGRELAETCLKIVVLEADEKAEIRFVAVRDGHYDFKDTLLPFTFGGGAIGVITIDPRQAVTVGSLNPVNLDEPAPAAPDEAEAAPNPFDAAEPAPDEAPNPFDAAEPAPDEAPNPFDAAEPAPDEAPNPFDTVEPAPDEAPNPFDTVEPVPAEAPGPMVQTMPPPAPAPPPEPDDGTDPFGALEPERSLPME